METGQWSIVLFGLSRKLVPGALLRNQSEFELEEGEEEKMGGPEIF